MQHHETVHAHQQQAKGELRSHTSLPTTMLGNAKGWVAPLVVCGFYSAAGPALILLNKYIMTHTGFHFPMALGCIGLIFSSCLAFILVKCKVVELKHRNDITPAYFFKNLLPVGAMSALTLSTGNLVYMYLSVAFIQMLKAFTPVVTMFLIFSFGLDRPHQEVILAVVGISIGTCVAAYGEVNFSIVGILLMAASEVAEALKLVFTQILLKNLKFSPIEGLYYLAPAAIICMIPGILFFEYAQMVETDFVKALTDNIVLLTLAGVLGFVVNTLTFFVIQYTSSVTLKVLAVARTAGLVLFCALFLNETVTVLEAIGYCISLSCFVWYNFIKVPAAPSTGTGASDEVSKV